MYKTPVLLYAKLLLPTVLITGALNNFPISHSGAVVRHVDGVDPGSIVESVTGEHGQTERSLELEVVPREREEGAVGDGGHDVAQDSRCVSVAAPDPEMTGIHYISDHHL